MCGGGMNIYRRQLPINKILGNSWTRRQRERMCQCNKACIRNPGLFHDFLSKIRVQYDPSGSHTDI